MEQPVKFGPDGNMIGMYSPASGQGDVCCLLINSGIVHRIGPHRLNVLIARGLAAKSLASLRFDLSGLGDSRPASSAASYGDQAVADIRAAMDFVERERGTRQRFVIFGICSGAVNAYHAALADPRIVGALMLDGFWYRTRWTEPVRLWKRFWSLSPRKIFDAIRRRLKRSARPPAREAAPQVEIFGLEGSGNPPREQFAHAMNQLDARGVGLFLLYTSSVTGLVSYSAQIAQAFRGEPFTRRLRCEAHAEIDHTAVSLDAQRRMTEIVSSWVAGFAAARKT